MVLMSMVITDKFSCLNRRLEGESKECVRLFILRSLSSQKS